MSKMIQLRHVPEGLHRQLKARAALEGLSLSDFLIREARKIADRPTPTEIRDRLAQRTKITPRTAPADAVRLERDQR
jgi:plasmid stability protein